MKKLFDLTYTPFPSYSFNTLCKGSSTKEGSSSKTIAKKERKIKIRKHIERNNNYL